MYCMCVCMHACMHTHNTCSKMNKGLAVNGTSKTVHLLYTVIAEQMS